MADFAIKHCKVGAFCAELLADEACGGDAEAIREAEADIDDIHANLMRSKFNGAKAGNERSIGKETKTHEDLLHKGAGSDLKDAARSAAVEAPGRAGAQR